jgi:hypothetical protein
MRLLWATALLFLAIQSAYAGECFKFDPAIVKLSGKVVPTMFYGPPNFGEDPKHVRKCIYPVLKLERPIRICEGQIDKSMMDVPSQASELQMVFFHPPYGANWNGKRVIVTGKLYSWDNANQHTPILISVINVEPASRGTP